MTQVLGFHYTLKNKLGIVQDSSEGKAPLLILTGQSQIIPDLEKEIIDLNVGDKKEVFIDHKNGYGEVNPNALLTLQRDQFPPEADLQIGVQFQMSHEANSPVFKIVKLTETEVHVDGNHPMAGVDLFFSIEIVEKRDATEEELSHGHAHGVGGHQH